MFRYILFAMAWYIGLNQIASAQMATVSAQNDEGTVRLYSGPAPGSENWTRNEVWTDFGEERWVRNVIEPTLIPVLPNAEIATGASVLLIPGGGFQFVSIDNEGYRVAEALKDKGIASFILKYRPMKTPQGSSEFSDYINRVWSGQQVIDRAVGLEQATADAVQAMKIIQSRASDWGIDPDQVGVLGFSAGAMAALELTTTTDVRPAFLGYIYGPMGEIDVPGDMPPLFAALAIDDPLFDTTDNGLVKAWDESGAPVEFHLYGGGGHGFGSYQKGTTSDLWLNQFVDWMGMQGFNEPSNP